MNRLITPYELNYMGNKIDQWWSNLDITTKLNIHNILNSAKKLSIQETDYTLKSEDNPSFKEIKINTISSDEIFCKEQSKLG